MVILGMLLITAAGVVTLGAVLANLGSTHLLAGDFAILGYHLEATAGELFGYGVLTGLIAAFGLYLVVVGVRRGIKQRAAARRALERAHRQQESLQQQRDRLAARLDHERGDAEPTPGRAKGTAPGTEGASGTDRPKDDGPAKGDQPAGAVGPAAVGPARGDTARGRDDVTGQPPASKSPV